jgi:hypothetical protein
VKDRDEVAVVSSSVNCSPVEVVLLLSLLLTVLQMQCSTAVYISCPTLATQLSVLSIDPDTLSTEHTSCCLIYDSSDV